MFGIIFPFLAAGFDEKTCLLPANYHPPHQTVINIPRNSPLPTLPLLQTKVREDFTITEKVLTSGGSIRLPLPNICCKRLLLIEVAVIVKSSQTFILSSSRYSSLIDQLLPFTV